MNLLEIKQLSNDVYLLSDKKLGHNNNSIVILTEEGPIIIDVFKDKDQFEEILNFIKSKGFNEPNTIIYTHWHIDHTCGNRIFDKCKVLAHESTYLHLENFLKNDLDRLKEKKILEKDVSIVMPNQTFTDELLINISNKTLKLIHCPGHTYDSILIYNMTDNILIAGDNLIGEEVPFFMPPTIPPDQIDTNSKYLESAFKTIQNLGVDIIVPGHGEIISAHKMIELNRKRYYKCLAENLKYVD